MSLRTRLGERGIHPAQTTMVATPAFADGELAPLTEDLVGALGQAKP
ncbi:MAG TPA: hypothetical protein VES73_02055 [Lamprocystis sp. (in: g-proteobacteria)]|nr:hypothetical protein [Lamprocystis sp. (in: g-proteobacteria)]